ncbi:TPA: superinfection exclusion protein [Serratia marcescens]|nr:superinfection exclusion protein [Serratia marcescens]HEJ8033613.1 superinfection exclusion protein [Serratia marcescens]
MNKFRVWHIPQVPMKSFTVEVKSVEEGVRMMDALADYDAFQYENNIKPDYCNANGLQMWDESLTEEDMRDMELSDKWVDWYNNEFDDPRDYIESLNEEITAA